MASGRYHIRIPACVVKLRNRTVHQELNVAVGKEGLILALILLTSCQRPPADPSASYQIVDEGRAKSKCLICVVPTSGIDCQGGGEAAELRWQLPTSAGNQSIRVLIEHPDGSRVEVATGSSAGHAALPQPVLPGDRVVLLAVENEEELMFARIQAPLGCALRPAQGGATTSTGPG